MCIRDRYQRRVRGLCTLLSCYRIMPAKAAKTCMVVDIIPQGEDVELETLIEQIKTIARDGIEVGESSLEPLMFGAKKLVQLVIIEDDKISSDLVVELIQALGDVGVEIVAFNTA
eukprot:TRINITY_DN1811_c0_g1_i10.p1 TRINITY_DN1811_c0_g1~~TRINITY_DN1811_c0_g1_i10.p1  ORF type:complete len:115 (+),score=42.72 TRINITY_DN1811_c0_g1_i10:180-524(+)